MTYSKKDLVEKCPSPLIVPPDVSHCHREMHQCSHDDALNIPSNVSVFLD